jgi:hypothetical protein
MRVFRRIRRGIEREARRAAVDARGRPVPPKKVVSYPPSESLGVEEAKGRREFLNAGKTLRRLHRSPEYRRVVRERGEADGVRVVGEVLSSVRPSHVRLTAERRVGWRRFAALVRFLKVASRGPRTDWRGVDPHRYYW